MLPRAEISTCDDLGAAPSGDVREQIKGESPRTGKSTMSEDSIRVEEAVRGKVKWFDASKGFGFIVSDDGGPDILLHANVLRNFGQGSVADNALVSVTVQHTERGVQAQEVLSIAPPSPEEALSGVALDIPETDAAFEAARIKWFDKGKGFGFANVFGKTDDVFLHAEVLRSFGFADLMPGEAVSIRVADGPRGKMAAEIRSWDHVREE